MVGLIASVIGNAFALWVTTVLVPGITFRGGLVTLVIAGAVWGIFNLIVRPIAMILSLPLLILTLGLFYFVLNGILLWVASFFLPGYSVAGVIPGILGALVMTVVNWAVGALVKKD
ncbi:MAG TPA: phage holin family protein [Vicinamibacteria bacterium]|nr:phage holin family protein [Vicinamibacteria bacterium]